MLLLYITTTSLKIGQVLSVFLKIPDLDIFVDSKKAKQKRTTSSYARNEFSKTTPE